MVLQIATAAVPGVTLDQVRGDGEANLGWWSGQLESRVLSWLVGGQARGATPLLMATVICSPEGTSTPSPISGVPGGKPHHRRMALPRERREAVIDRSRPGVTCGS